MIIKKWNSTTTAWEEQHPKTLESMIYSSENTETNIFDSGKLKQQYLPDSVFGGMTFVGTVSDVDSGNVGFELKNLIAGTPVQGYTISSNLDAFTGKTWPDDYDDIGQRYIGHYWIVGNGGIKFIDSALSTEQADWATATFDDGIAPIQDGDDFGVLELEAGDWVIITGWDNTNNTFKINIVNNTYDTATTVRKGLVELATGAEVDTGTSTTLVPTVAQLKAKYALKSHTHADNQIVIADAYTNIGSSADDTLNDVLNDIDNTFSVQAASILTNADDIAVAQSDISTLTSRKTLFVETDAPTANQNNDIWFDI